MFKAAKINIADLARYLGLERQIVNGWESGARPIPEKYKEGILNYITQDAVLKEACYNKVKESMKKVLQK